MAAQLIGWTVSWILVRWAVRRLAMQWMGLLVGWLVNWSVCQSDTWSIGQFIAPQSGQLVGQLVCPSVEHMVGLSVDFIR